MRNSVPRRVRPLAALAVSSALLTTAACSTLVETEHYVGVYDVEQQVTQELFRVKIRGSAGCFSNVQYASGWVPAEQADLLANKIELAKNGAASITGDPSAASLLAPTRRYYEMGPLGVNLAPEKGRFVIVMNSDPDEFFKRIATLTRFSTEQDSKAAMTQRCDALLRKVSSERIRVLQSIDATGQSIDTSDDTGGDE